VADCCDMLCRCHCDVRMLYPAGSGESTAFTCTNRELFACSLAGQT
jgi:hypothetical protein